MWIQPRSDPAPNGRGLLGANTFGHLGEGGDWAVSAANTGRSDRVVRRGNAKDAVVGVCKEIMWWCCRGVCCWVVAGDADTRGAGAGYGGG